MTNASAYPSSAADALSMTLRDLGLRARTYRPADLRKPVLRADFSVRTRILRDHYRRTGERITDYVFVVPLSDKAHEVIIANADAITERMAGYLYHVTVDVRTSRTSGRQFASLGTV